MGRSTCLAFVLVAIVALLASVPGVAFGASPAPAHAACDDDDRRCPELRIELAGLPDSITTDSFTPFSVVISNAKHSAETLPGGTSLFLLTFSHEVGVGKYLQVPAGFECSPPAAPVRQVECHVPTTGAATIAANSSIEFTLKVSVPTKIDHITAKQHLRLVATLAGDTHESRAVGVVPVTARPLKLTFGPGRIVFDCSGDALPFGIHFGSMTCQVSYIGLSNQSGPVTVPAGISFLHYDVFGLALNGFAVNTRVFACSNRAGFSTEWSLFVDCSVPKPLLLQPKDKVTAFTFSTWNLSGLGVVDWSARDDFAGVGSGPAGGSAGD